jgi:predicted  nucleic acid-binding Zn-ribbon protein
MANKNFVDAEKAAERLETSAKRLAEAIERVEARVTSATAALAALDPVPATQGPAKTN